MISKSIIAHELGHAVLMYLDNEFKATTISLKPDDDGCLAYCNCKKIKDNQGNMLNQKNGNLSGISDLGGVFGELIFNNKWYPWGCRLDIDDFTSNNTKSRSKVVNEVFNWMWNDDDKLSFIGLKSEKTRHRKSIKNITEKQTKNRLPELWKLYQDFLSKIDEDEFNDIVNEIHREKKTNVRHNTIKKYIKRIVK